MDVLVMVGHLCSVSRRESLDQDRRLPADSAVIPQLPRINSFNLALVQPNRRANSA